MYLQILTPILLLLMSLNAFGANQTASDRGGKWSDLETTFEQHAKENGMPGMAAAVVKEGQIVWSYTRGYSEANNEIPVSLDTPFWIASVTKPFVGLTYLLLEHEGKVALSEKAHKTPNFQSLCTWLASTEIPFAKGMTCSREITIEHILKHQTNAVPGTTFMYNPILYSRLSRHLEHKLGEGVDAVEGRHNRLGQLIESYILTPAGMNKTMASMWDPAKAGVLQQIADGFRVNANGERQKLPQPEKHIAGGAGVVSTINDLVKFERHVMLGTLLPDEVTNKLSAWPAFEDGSAAPYGYGWYFEKYQQETLMWHSGWDPEHGYSAMYLRIPDRKLTLIVLANTESLYWANSLTKAEIVKSPLARAFLEEAVAANAGMSKITHCKAC
ncbi:beta-lactamase family protein [Alteromonas sp. ASW11-19]|uniref:Beta-lactamase family protein n=1 Tax=Alteromonas salexigens TaxID=2982530 RepID=A0ABT2VMN2_9ALTE|nr:serine hydrolase domain-containing protein [Alteromonas salexigens]MCU7554575.1 beta-lactamase family protein [Alteromonas salexigens]